MEGIIGSLITGGLALAGVIFTNIMGNKKFEAQLDKKQAITDVKIDALTEEVKKHNDFATRVPVIEEQIKVANHRLEDLEKKVG